MLECTSLPEEGGRSVVTFRASNEPFYGLDDVPYKTYCTESFFYYIMMILPNLHLLVTASY